MKRYCRFVKTIIPALLLFWFASCRQSKETTPSDARLLNILDSIYRTDPLSPRTHYFLDSLLSANPKASPAAKYEYYSRQCGYYHITVKDESKALQYADSMLWIVHTNPAIPDYDKKDAFGYVSKGDVLFAQKQYTDAYQFYYQGKVAAEKSLDPCTYSEYSYRLGMVMYKKTNYADAAFYFRQGFDESGACPESFNNFYRRQELLNNTALGYKKNGQPDSALAYYNKALKFLDDNEPNYKTSKTLFSVARGVVYGNMGQIYASFNRPKAEELYNQSIQINSVPGADINDALLTQQHLADLYYDEKEYNKMYSVLEDMRRGLDTIKNDAVKVSWNKLMWKYYDSKKDFTTAYKYLETHSQLKDEEAEANKTLIESDVTSQMKNIDADYKMQLLKKDSKLKQLYFGIIAAFTFSLIIILLLILYNWRKSRKNLLALTLLNSQVNKQKEQLENTLGELEERNKEKDRILGIVAHDLRNPVSAISSLITLMEDGYDYTAEQQKLLKLMQSACKNSVELINEILEFSANDAGDSEAHNEPVDINNIAANCVRLLSFKAAEKKQKIELNLSGSAEYVKANPARVWRIISNLLTNAVKFSPSGATIRVATTHNNGNVIISVEDSGIGIPDDMKERIFDSHTKARRVGTNGEKPFGLGLSICKQIVESYHGKIWFNTAGGKGTSFYVSLPLHNK